jgi:RNA polymerase sigma factor (TIGR02999 family)
MNESDRSSQSGEGSEWISQPSEPVRALADRLVPLFYDELKRLAHRERSRVRADVTLQTTVLVNEAYLKLRSAAGWNDDQHFLCAAALAMRHVLINHAKSRLAAKRGNGADHVSLTEAPDIASSDDQTLVSLHEALERLAAEAPRLAQVVECRYFGGFDEVSTAKALNLSERTVRRDWALARAWLNRELSMQALS